MIKETTQDEYKAQSDAIKAEIEALNESENSFKKVKERCRLTRNLLRVETKMMKDEIAEAKKTQKIGIDKKTVWPDDL